MAELGFWLAGIGAVALAATFLLYPLWLIAANALLRPARLETGHIEPRFNAVIAFRGGGALLDGKVADLAALDYPPEEFEVLLISDGPLAEPVSAETAGTLETRGWQLLETEVAGGKNQALRFGLSRAEGDILLFSDLDARLETDCLRRIAPYFADDGLGGVCGQRRIDDRDGERSGAQSSYIAWDSWIKALESRRGFLSSNDGKLYAVRRSLVDDVPDAVTDDLYVGLAVQAKGSAMLFDPVLTARIPKPCRSGRHELSRRRRIVCRSLNGLWLNRRLLNPLRHDGFAFALLFNKVFRRLTPVFLMAIWLGAVFAAASHTWAAMLAAAIPTGAAAACSYALLEGLPLPSSIRKTWAATYYVLLGNVGMLLGVWDFLRGHRVSAWDPIKTDS